MKKEKLVTARLQGQWSLVLELISKQKNPLLEAEARLNLALVNLFTTSATEVISWDLQEYSGPHIRKEELTPVLKCLQECESSHWVIVCLYMTLRNFKF